MNSREASFESGKKPARAGLSFPIGAPRFELGTSIPQTTQRAGGGWREVARSGSSPGLPPTRPRNQAEPLSEVWATFGPRPEQTRLRRDTCSRASLCQRPSITANARPASSYARSSLGCSAVSPELDAVRPTSLLLTRGRERRVL